jgi:hypothetical protein
MKEASVKGAFIIQPGNHLYDHTYVASVLKQHPDKFVGALLANPTSVCPFSWACCKNCDHHALVMHVSIYLLHGICFVDAIAAEATCKFTKTRYLSEIHLMLYRKHVWRS